MRRFWFATLITWSLFAQDSVLVNPLPRRLPGGITQREAIVRDDFRQNVADSLKLARLAREVRVEFATGDKNIVSVATLKKLDEIEKLTKNIRGRLKRY